VIEDLERRKYRLSTELFDGEGECVIDGEAVVLLDSLPDTDGEGVDSAGDPEDADRDGSEGAARSVGAESR